MKLRPLLTCVLALILAAACDDSFSPLQESDLKFSVFGYLDAAADTQWIRISPVRTTTLTRPDALGVRVTLEHVATGRVVEMRDSVFRYATNPEIGTDSAYFHNFWTAERIEPGATYRFTVRREAEEPSEAVVPVPSDYLVEVWLNVLRPGNDVLRLVGLRQVAFVEAQAAMRDVCGRFVARRPFETGSPDTDVQMIPIYRRASGRAGCGGAGIDRWSLWIVGSGAAWPRGAQFSASGLSVTDVPSNVSKAVGYLGGVLVKRIPYEYCRIEGAGASPEEYCRLRYDEAAATLKGTVRDVLCTGDGVLEANVDLTEIDPGPSGGRKVRYAMTGPLGEFEIGALEPGRRYALRVSRFLSTRYEKYLDHTDTLQFTPGETRTYDVGLRRLECPPEGPL